MAGDRHTTHATNRISSYDGAAWVALLATKRLMPPGEPVLRLIWTMRTRPGFFQMQPVTQRKKEP